jgi:tight adherence protein B
MGLIVAAFVTTLTLVLGVYWYFIVRPERKVRETFWKRLKTNEPETTMGAGLLKQAQQLSALPSFDAVLNRGRLSTRSVAQLIEQSGSRLTVGTFMAATGLCALVTAYAVYWVTGMLLAGLAAGALAATAPAAALRLKRTKRVLRFEEQFPEALALISRALKAGHTFTTGLGMVAEEMPAPIGPEFKLLYDQQNYGMPLPDALKEFAGRVPLLDARFFVTAVLIQRESGGNLSEVLDNLATVIRDRFRVKRQIRVISAHARMTGWVLIGVPPALACVMFLINADHWETMTGSQLGINMMIGAIVMQIIGSLIIRKLVQIEY